MNVLEEHQFHEFIRKKRSELHSLSSRVKPLHDYIENLEGDLEGAKFKKRLAIEKKIKKAKDRLVYITSGKAEKEFEDKITPFSNEFSKRLDERNKMQKRKKDETQSRVPQIKNKRELVMSLEASAMSDNGIAAFIQGEGRDPNVVTDELKIELADDNACMYLNPHDMCEDCDVPMELALSHPILICPLCHATRIFLDVTSASMGFGKNVEFTRFNYERVNHFRDYLIKFQAKEKAVVPEEILVRVMEQLKLLGKTREKTTIMDIREIMRERLKASDWYDNISQIYCRVLNKPPPCLSEIQVQKYTSCFQLIQGPFERRPKDDRKNFLSYSYCMNKFSQLLGYDYLVKFFPLLRGPKKLQRHDNIWKFICDEVDWEFIPSDTAG